MLVPDSVRGATVDGVPVPITDNGLLVVITGSDHPSRVVVRGRKGAVTVTFSWSGGLGNEDAITGRFD